MIWLLVLALAGGVFVQGRRLETLRTRIDGLERRILDLKDRLETRASTADRVRREDVWSANPGAPAAAVPRPGLAQPTTFAPVPERAESPEPASATPPPPPPPPPPSRKGPPPREVARAWLEENGLAWAGGAALGLGGLFLVAYAAQRGVFTPAMRIAAAVTIGFVLLAASEWLKARSGHLLAAAVAAGAGAATLYGAVWASYWLYAFLPIGVAGGLLAAVSLGLLAQAFRYGEPLAILGILGGFLAPAITGPENWSAPALSAYLGLITLTGYLVAALRHWGWAGAATLVGALAWAVAGFSADGYVRVAILGLAPFILACAAVEWRRGRGEPPRSRGTSDLFALMPAAALASAAALLSALWLGRYASPIPLSEILRAGLVGAAVLALAAAFAARRGLFAPVLLPLGWIPAASFVVSYGRPFQADLREAGAAALIVSLAAAGAVAGAGRTPRTLRFAAAGAALVILLLATTLSGPLSDNWPWASGAAAAILLVGAATIIARRGESPQTDLPLALWIWAAGAAGFYSLQQGIDPRYLPIAAAALSLTAALAHARLGWRGFAGVMLAAATGSLAALMSPALFEALGEGDIRWWGLALVAGGSAGLTFAGARIAERGGRPRQSAEALGTGAILIALAGAGVLLRFAASPSAGGGGSLDLFMEAGLRTVLILAAGLVSAQAVRADSSWIGRWRGQGLLLVGAIHGLVFSLLAFNPLFAAWTPAVAGPKIFDALALGFLVPAILLGVATWKRVAVNRPLLAVYACGAAGFSVVWAAMEIRRLFQGASLHAGLDGIGRAEAGAYALLALIGARAVIWLGEQAQTRALTVTPLAPEIAVAGRWSAGFALAFAVLVFGYGASPWWGPVGRPLAGLNATVLLLGFYVVAGGASFLLAAPAVRLGASLLARAARLTVVIIAFALLNLVVRLGFRGFDMRPYLTEASLETWAFSAVWALFGFGLLIFGAARRSNDLRAAGMTVLIAALAKIFLFDMSRLEGVIRAASFLAVGALLLTAAVLLRRLAREGALPFGRTEGAAPAPPEV